MKIEINISEYDIEEGLEYEWGDDCSLVTQLSNNSLVIEGNKPALELLAHHLFTLAQDEVPAQSHIHYDDLNFLKPGSCEFIIVRK